MSLNPFNVLSISNLRFHTNSTAFPIPPNYSEQATLSRIYFDILYRDGHTTTWELTNYLAHGSYAQIYVMTSVGLTTEETRAIKFVKGGDNEAHILQSLPGNMPLQPPFDIFDGIFEITHSWRQSLKSCNKAMWKRFEGFESVVIMKKIRNLGLHCLIDNEAVSQPYFSLPAIRQISYDLIDALAFMREYKISHGDIKLENIMLDSSGKGILLDFGAARICEQGPMAQMIGPCTMAYLPPECCDDIAEFDPEKRDVWALGVVLFRLFARMKEMGRIRNTLEFWSDFEYDYDSPRFQQYKYSSGEEFTSFKRFLRQV